MESIASYLIPRPILDKLASTNGVRSGLASGFGWVLHGDLLEFWRYSDGRTAEVRSLRLPNALTAYDSNANATLFVSILSQGKARAVSVLICSSKGVLAAWMDANLFNVDPTIHSLIPYETSTESSPPIITSFSAIVPSEASGHQAVFLASAGLSDGSWALLQGSTSQGILSKRINQKALTHSTPITSSSSSLPPLLTKLTSAVAWGLQEAFDPSARILRKTPGSGGVASIQILSVDTTKVRVLILYEASLDCWQVNLGLRPSELLLWSFCNLNLAQTLTTTNTSSSNPRRPGPESRNALLSNLPLTSFLDSTSRCVYVWMLDSGEGSPRHYLQKIILDSSSPSSSSSSSSLAPIHDWCVHVEPMDACGSRASSPMHLSGWGGVGDGGSCLMMAGPGHVLVECWVPDSSRSTLRSSGGKGGKGGGGEGEVKGLPSSRLLSSDPDNLALAPFINPNPPPPSQGHQGQGPLQAAYLVLSTTYGVIELPPPSTTSTSTSIMGHGSGPLTHDQIQQVFQLLDTTCHQALLLRQQHQQRGQDLHQPSAPDPNSNSNLNLNLRGWPPLRALVSGLTRRLQSLSAFSPSTNLEVLLKYSSHLCDQTPTEWAQASLVNLTAGSNNNNSGGFGGGGGGVSFIEQLRDKGSRHESFLAILAESGILRGLDPLLQISLVENQEKLAAAHDLLTLQSTLSSHLASQGGPPSGLQLLADNLELMEGLTARSGLLSFSGPNDTPGGQGGGQRVKGLERFYSQPTLSTPHLFQSISESSQVISRQFESDPGSKESLLMRSRLSFLSKSLGTVVAASNKVRSMAQKQYRMDLGHLYVSLGRPGWWQGPEPRSKIETLLEHIQAAVASSPSHAATAATAGGMQSDPAPLLFDPSPTLYESYDLRDLSRSMFGVTEVLFSAHAATVASAPLSLSLSLSLDASNTLSSLKPKSSCLSEYREARVKHAPPLYSQAISELPPLSSYARGGGGGYSSSVVDPDSLIWHLEDLFSSHHCYPELFSTTRYLTLLVRLHQQHASTATRPPSTFHHHPPLSTSHASSGHPREAQREVYSRMHACMTRMAAEDGAPERETFSNYVFQQLLDLGLHSELLSLPMDKFKSGLVAFLQPHPQLLWLLWLLIDKGSQGGSRAVGGTGLKEATLALSCTSDLARQAKDMRSHYRLECLATLSSYAEQDPHSSRLHSSRLHLVHIQRELFSLAGGVGGNVECLSTLEESVDLALSLARKSDRGSQKSDHAVLLALKTLLVCPRGELEGNQERWREVWRQLLLATNWPRLGQEGGSQGQGGRSRNVRRPRQDQDQGQGQGQNEPEPEPEGEGEGVVRVGELGPALMDTPLYLGALSCGGREAMGFMGDGTFNPKRVAEVRGWINEWCLDLAASGELGLDRSGHFETTPSQIKGKGKEVDAVAVGATATGRVTRSSRKVQQSPQALLLTPAGRGKRVAGEVALDPAEERRAIMELPIAAFELALAQIS